MKSQTCQGGRKKEEGSGSAWGAQYILQRPTRSPVRRRIKEHKRRTGVLFFLSQCIKMKTTTRRPPEIT